MNRTSETGDEPVLTPPEPVAPIAPGRAATIIPDGEAIRTALDERDGGDL
ncbi:hypothetical protein SAMN04489712_103357 [Thermomonospora echinospora]|uniref:Uncharacterized protein n=1 Tax=Thermomonospora echinospora TaxID=1992 RepID=A0A1H5XRH0_9ACTN|nr:hypothetical protein [Thermomonospora echinospora]SEG13856.1 hypothetical protein SAMN04489712_103357 [Thermomonospora echinospora]